MLFTELEAMPPQTKVVTHDKELVFFIGISKNKTYACFCREKNDSLFVALENDLTDWSFYVEPPVDRTAELTVLCANLQGEIEILKADKQAFKDSLDFVVSDRDTLLQQKAALEAEKAALQAALDAEKAKGV